MGGPRPGGGRPEAPRGCPGQALPQLGLSGDQPAAPARGGHGAAPGNCLCAGGHRHQLLWMGPVELQRAAHPWVMEGMQLRHQPPAAVHVHVSRECLAKRVLLRSAQRCPRLLRAGDHLLRLHRALRPRRGSPRQRVLLAPLDLPPGSHDVGLHASHMGRVYPYQVLRVGLVLRRQLWAADRGILPCPLREPRRMDRATDALQGPPPQLQCLWDTHPGGPRPSGPCPGPPACPPRVQDHRPGARRHGAGAGYCCDRDHRVDYKGPGLWDAARGRAMAGVLLQRHRGRGLRLQPRELWPDGHRELRGVLPSRSGVLNHGHRGAGGQLSDRCVGPVAWDRPPVEGGQCRPAGVCLGVHANLLGRLHGLPGVPAAVLRVVLQLQLWAPGWRLWYLHLRDHRHDPTLPHPPGR
eukprot:RCo027739